MNLISIPILFCGVELTLELKKLLASAPQPLKDQFIGNSPNYLQIVPFKQSDYIGKQIGPKCDASELELAAENISSILKRIIPEFDSHLHPPTLITLESLNHGDA